MSLQISTRQLKFESACAVRPAFYPTLRKRVDAYFRESGSTRKANTRMLLKMGFCLGLFFGLYAAIISDRFSPQATITLVLLFGMASALVGFNIAHDAVHGALFASRRLNRIFGLGFELIGLSSYVWYLKHNLVHHNNPNVVHADFDIEAGPVLRLSPADKLLPHHYYQHIYAPLAYMLFSLSMIFGADFRVVFGMGREDIDRKKHARGQQAILLFSKAGYVFFMLALPMMVTHYTWWQVLTGFLLMHCTLSVVAFVLIPAHLFEQTVYRERNGSGHISGSWAVHQMETTIDYARESRLCNFLLGGFNINVGHHLFPRICHVHLIPLSRIIRQTAREFGVPYHETSLWGAVISHFRTLKILGRQEHFPSTLPSIN